MRDCPLSSRGAVDPANRGSSGSHAIDDRSGAKAQSGQRGRLQAELCAGAGAGATLVWLASRA
jgi:hypothetical protein